MNVSLFFKKNTGLAISGGNKGGCSPAHTHTLFCVAERKKGKQKKEIVPNHFTIKRLSPRSKC